MRKVDEILRYTFRTYTSDSIFYSLYKTLLNVEINTPFAAITLRFERISKSTTDV